MMRPARRTPLGLTALLLLTPAILAAQPERAVQLARIDSVVAAEMARTLTPGTSVAVEHRGQLVFARGYGLANVETNTRASAETIYRIGSVTKQFTAAAVMQLVEQGKIGLDDDLTKFLPDYPTQGNRVTIRHLLTHTSGIKSYTALGPKFWNESSRIDLSTEQMLALFKDVPFDFKPGEKYAYNNSAFFLLGVIIEKVTGLPYARYIDEKIVQPQGLAATSYCDDRAIVPHRSAGYEAVAGKVYNAAPLSMTSPAAAGALCSTVIDLVRWQRAFDEARVTSAGSRDQIRTPATLNDGKSTNYGFGLGVGTFERKKVFSHSGGINGFASWLGRYPDDELTIAVLTNSGGGPAVRIGELVARVMLGIPLPTIRDLPVPPASRKAVVGRYQMDGTALVVTDGAEGLEISIGGQAPTRLLSQGNGEFRPQATPDISIRFETAAGVSQMVIEAGGNRMVARRGR